MERESTLKFDISALSDVGCKRSNNEDSFGYDEAAGIFAVCDGMGGLAAGEVASSTAIAELLGCFKGSADSAAGCEERLHEAILHANRQVRALSKSREELNGMGTTLVSACLDGGRLVVGNVGDSRAYFLRGGECAQITLDHSYVAEQVRSGAMTPEDAGASPLQSLITRAVGTADAVEPDIFTAELEDGDMLLLTTDGLTRYADSEEIAGVVAASTDLESACRGLIDTALRQGAVDNVTCVLVRFCE